MCARTHVLFEPSLVCVHVCVCLFVYACVSVCAMDITNIQIILITYII